MLISAEFMINTGKRESRDKQLVKTCMEDMAAEEDLIMKICLTNSLAAVADKVVNNNITLILDNKEVVNKDNNPKKIFLKIQM